jgi:hypothetical protein
MNMKASARCRMAKNAFGKMEYTFLAIVCVDDGDEF